MRLAAAVASAAIFAAACSKAKDSSKSLPPASVARSQMSLAAGSVAADGLTPATVTVTVRDDAGKPISGASVSLSYTGAANLPSTVTTDARGVAVFHVTANAPTSGEVTATVSTKGSVLLAGAPPLLFHGCNRGRFVHGACVPLPFVTFPPAMPINSAGVSPMQFAVGDLDGNGLADVVVPDAAAGYGFDFLLADGEGNFWNAGRVENVGTRHVAIADVTRDAIPDVIAGARLNGQCSIQVFRGIGDGLFKEPISTPTPNWCEDSFLAVADLDGDGSMDVIGRAAGGFSVYLNQGNGTFGARAVFSDGGSYSPSAVAVADLNGDGSPDVVLAFQNANAVVARLGNGDGTFGAPVSAPTGANPRAVALADVDGDGYMDVVVADSGGAVSFYSAAVGVLLGNGDGTLAAETEYPTGSTRSITAGDLDGDGHADVVTADSNCRVSVSYGTAGGGLEPAGAYDGGQVPWDVAIARLNGDANPDLVVLDYARGTVFGILGQSARTFAAARASPYISTFQKIAAGDFDGDGHVDVMAAGYPEPVFLARGRGDGTFYMPAQRAVVGDPGGGRAVAAGDLDGDGRADFIVLNVKTNEVSIIFGDPSGELGPATVYPVGQGPAAAAVGDLNGDGLRDLVVANGAYNGGTVSVLLGQGGGTLASEVRFPAGNFPRDIALGDLDGDGHLDAVVFGFYFSYYPLTRSIELRVLKGDGQGGFAAPVAYSAGSLVSESGVSGDGGMVLADFNGDGHLDAAVTDQGGNSVGVFQGEGDGTFSGRVAYPVGPRPLSLAVGDVDGDGHLDLVTSDTNGTVTLVRGKGDGTFFPGFSTYTGYGPGPALVANLDGDIYGDVAVPVSSSPSGLLVFRGSPSGLEGWPPVTMGSQPTRMRVADLNGDGHLDLVTSNYYTQMISVALGKGDGTFGQAMTYGVAGYPGDLAIADLNGDGIPDLVLTHIGGQVGVLLGNGNGTFQPEITSDAGSGALGLAVGDVTGDGKTDAIVGANGSALLLPGLGNGYFGSPVALSASAGGLQQVMLADLNGDSKLDLVTAYWPSLTSSAATAEVLLGNGDGTFQPATVFVAYQAGGVHVADLDGDGHLDIAVGSNTQVMTLLLGRGDGTFIRETRILSNGASYIASGDLDLDGDLDLVTTGGYGEAFVAQRNDGTGSFEPFTFKLPAQIWDLAVADLDGDSRPDVLLLSRAGVFPLLNRVP